MKPALIVSYEKGLKFRISKTQFLRVYQKAMLRERHSLKPLELHFVGSKTIQKLNKEFRRKDKATDVLSFPSHSPLLLGTIVIDIQTAARQAKEFEHSRLQEVRELFVHGIFHLLGYDHETEKDARLMAKKEDQLNRLWTTEV